ncbi:hypothetical protein [uncultured Lacinutrix sp.]|uniref:hypothetical protein n=1 Tax=uncultured Lacinutrix sp. TaxID=574032 RepID=UPI002613A483|nr:hypothetical protein [uncultured Lacinutrix sp.]
MKQKVKNNVSENNSITVFRYKMADLEQQLLKQHETIKKDVAIPLGKDLGNMKPSKPEANCEKDVYSGVINGAYSKMMMTAKKELQSEIESHHIVADKAEADRKLQELETELEKTETDYRLKKRELEKCDNTLKKKAARYKWTRLILMFLVLVDTLISGTALQAMGYPLITSYIIGLAIGIGIFYIAEHLHEIIDKGKTLWQKRLIAVTVFVVLFGIFYVLGIFRTTTFRGNDVFGGGAGPLYFACLNLFFTAVATLVVTFAGLSRAEKKIWDKYRIAEDEAKQLKKEVDELKLKIAEVRKQQKESELARTQIQIYAHDMQELIQRLYEESQKTFYSTNCIHRSDGKVPKFFEDDIPMLPSFYKGLSI